MTSPVSAARDGAPVNGGERYDGPTLRSVRTSVGVPLRRVATLAKMSHGHLSKVERGDQGRPVTPVVVAAYEKATGVRLSDATIIDDSVEVTGAGWRQGQLSDVGRLGFNARLAAVAVGGPTGEPVTRMIDAIGQMATPARVGIADVTMVEQAARFLTSEDLRSGGGLSVQLTRVTLRWAVGLTNAAMTAPVYSRLHTAIGWVAHRAGWAAFDADAHEAARCLFTVGLDAAIRAKDRDLRAHVIADVAAQHNHLGFPDDALEIVSLAEGDQRISPAVRIVLHAVKARAHAAAGHLPESRAHLHLVEQHHTTSKDRDENGNGWQASLLSAAYLDAAIGHTAAALARRTRVDTDWDNAHQRLHRAVDTFNPATHTRARTLCLARLAIMHLDVNDHPAGIGWARQALEAGTLLRSARLVRYLKAIQGSASAHPEDTALQQLATDIDTTLHPPSTPQQEPAQPPPADTDTHTNMSEVPT